MAVAKARAAQRVVLDDREARRCARALGLRVIGTLGIVGRAKERGLIGRAAPLIRQLREKGLYATDDLVESLLNEIGEGNAGEASG
mgnify:CR=1 FL=1